MGEAQFETESSGYRVIFRRLWEPHAWRIEVAGYSDLGSGIQFHMHPHF
jgi:hypothetical protein